MTSLRPAQAIQRKTIALNLKVCVVFFFLNFVQKQNQHSKSKSLQRVAIVRSSEHAIRLAVNYYIKYKISDFILMPP